MIPILKPVITRLVAKGSLGIRPSGSSNFESMVLNINSEFKALLHDIGFQWPIINCKWTVRQMSHTQHVRTRGTQATMWFVMSSVAELRVDSVFTSIARGKCTNFIYEITSSKVRAMLALNIQSSDNLY